LGESDHSAHNVVHGEVVPVVRVTVDPNRKFTIGSVVAGVDVFPTPGPLNFEHVFLVEARSGKHPGRICLEVG
jgi:hypothetical protein